MHENRRISDQDVSATDLLVALERCLFDGIRIKEFFGTFPFWYLLQLLPSAREQVEELAAILALQTSVAKSRAFLRLALNSGRGYLEEVLTSLLQSERLLKFFFRDRALLRRPQEASVLIAMVRSLKVLRFSFSLEPRDLKALNTAPEWLHALAASQLMNTPVIPADAAASISTTLEKGFGYFFRRLDDVAQELLLSQGVPASAQPLPTAFLHATLSIYDYGTLGSAVAGGFRHVDPPFFGTPLGHLMRAETRCRTTHSSRSLGVPNQVDALLEYLSRCLTVPGLFIRTAALADMQALRLSLENEQGIPPNSSPFAVASCLMQWLYELPEPLLGFEMFDAFQACQRDIESEVHRLRNFSLLVEAAPWYCKPTLHRVMELLKALSNTESSRCTGLGVVQIANLSASFLLRSPVDCPTVVHEEVLSKDNLEMLMHVTAACGPVAEVLILHANTVFEPLAIQMQTLQDNLNDKISNIKEIQALAVKYISNPSLTPSTSLRKLWMALAPCEALIQDRAADKSTSDDSSSGVVDSSNDDLNENDSDGWLQSPRWKVCFPTVSKPDDSIEDNEVDTEAADQGPMKFFDALPGGLLAVDSLTSFLRMQPAVASRLVQNFALRECSACFLPLVCVNVSQMCLVELKLVSGRTLFAAANRKEADLQLQHVSIEQLSRLHVWNILVYNDSYADIFGVALQIFDDLWKIADPKKDDDVGNDVRRGDLEANLFSNCMVGTRILLNELLKMAPRSSEEMYKFFNELRIHREPAVIEGLNFNTTLNQETSNTGSQSGPSSTDSSDVSDSATATATKMVDIGDAIHFPDCDSTPVEDTDVSFDRQPCILTAEQIEALDAQLPPELKYCNWKLKYK